MTSDSGGNPHGTSFVRKAGLFRGWLTLGFILATLNLVAWSAARGAPPSLEDFENAAARIRAESRAREAEAEAEKTRLNVMLKAFELETIRKSKIANERERIANEIESKTKYNEAIRQWAGRESDLNVIPRTRLGDGTFSPFMNRWAVSREVARQEFLTFPEKSKGAVRSGRALNFFLDALGRSAVKHEQLMTQLRALGDDPQVVLNAELSSAENALAAAIQNPAITKQERLKLTGLRDSAQARLVVWKLCEPLKITPAMRRDLNLQSGITGPKLGVNLVQGALPLNWPPYLMSDQELTRLTKRITETRDQAIRELQEKNAISPKTQNLLLEYVDALDREFNRNHRPQLKKLPTGGAEFDRIFENIKFIRDLRGGVFRFLRARFPDDVAPPKFESNSLSELLAFMVDKGYRFGEAAPESEVAHLQLFEMMSKYYADLYGLHLAVSKNETEMESLRADSKKLAQEEFRETTSAILASGQTQRPGLIELMLQAGVTTLVEQGVKNLVQSPDEAQQSKLSQLEQEVQDLRNKLRKEKGT